MGRITFDDKVATRESGLPRENTITDEDVNEIKGSVNALYDTATWTFEVGDDLSVSLVGSPAKVKILSIEKSVDSADVSINVNGNSYTFGEPIEKWDSITVLSDVPVVVNASVEAIYD